MISKRGKIRRHRHLNYSSQVMEKYKESSQGIIIFGYCTLLLRPYFCVFCWLKFHLKYFYIHISVAKDVEIDSMVKQVRMYALS